MNRNFKPAYSELQCKPDNIEIIRDQIAALLALEFESQYTIANEQSVSNKADYKVTVYVENDDPLQYIDNITPDANPFPCVNVSIDSSDGDKGTASVNKQTRIGQFFLDVYATGNTKSVEDMGKRASLKAWKTARLVRRILRAEPNTFLRLRGIVGKIDWKMQGYSPDDEKSAIRVKVVRITLGIDFVEDVEITKGVLNWEIEGIITDENGKVILKNKNMEISK